MSLRIDLCETSLACLLGSKPYSLHTCQSNSFGWNSEYACYDGSDSLRIYKNGWVFSP